MSLYESSTEKEEEPAGDFLRMAALLYLFMALGAVLWIGWREGRIELGLFLSKESWWQDIFLGLGAGLAMAGGWEITRRSLVMARRLEESLKSLLGGIGRDEVVGLALLSGFSEELFFRGAVQLSWGFLPATLLFAVLHTGRGREYRVWTGAALVSGFVLGGLLLWRGNLLAAMTAHMVVNAVGLERLRRG